MDNLEKLTAWILEQAEREAEEIRSAARQKREAALRAAEERLRRDFEEKSKALRKQTEERILAAERREETLWRKERARYLAELTDRCFDEALRLLCELPEPEFEAFYDRVLAESVPPGRYRLRVGERSLSSLSFDWQSRLARRGERTVEPAPEPVPDEGGFLLESGPLEYSFLFGDLLADLKSSQGAAIMRMLFAESAD